MKTIHNREREIYAKWREENTKTRDLIRFVKQIQCKDTVQDHSLIFF